MKNAVLTLALLATMASCSAKQVDSWACGNWTVVVDHVNQTMLVTGGGLVMADKAVYTGNWVSIQSSVENTGSRNGNVGINLATSTFFWAGVVESCSKQQLSNDT